MTTKKRNTPKKAAAKPRSAPRRTKAETIAETISRKLDDLLDAQAARSIHPVHALTPVELGSIDATPSPMWRNAIKNDAAEPTSKPRSPIDDAISRLFEAISRAECETAEMEQRLEQVITPMPTPANAVGKAEIGGGKSILVGNLHDIADRIYADISRRHALRVSLEL